MPSNQVIQIAVSAPPKPPEGMACNGCGVCCLAQPCPLGIVLSGKRHGACNALRWVEVQRGPSRYVCGAIDAPLEVLRAALPVPLKRLASPGAKVLPWLARRWIAAGVGCDSSLEPQLPSLPTPASSDTIPL